MSDQSQWEDVFNVPTLSSASMDDTDSSLEEGEIRANRDVRVATPEFVSARLKQSLPHAPKVYIESSSTDTYTDAFDSPAMLDRDRKHPETQAFDDVRVLGHGGNGNCLLVKHRREKYLRVCKVTRSYRGASSMCMDNEIRHLKWVLPEHERIVRMHQHILTPTTLEMYFDYYAGGDLSHFMKKHFENGEKFTESFILHVYEQLAEALTFIHTGYDALKNSYDLPVIGSVWKPIIHGDIKPLNIFLKSPTKGRFPDLVLGDFGNSESQPGKGIRGTYPWIGPEIGYYGLEGDIWGVGAIIHALCHDGKPPILPLPEHIPSTPKTRQEWQHSPEARYCAPPGPDYSSELACVLTTNMAFVPAMRPGARLLLEWVYEMIVKRLDYNIGNWYTIAVKPPKKKKNKKSRKAKAPQQSYEPPQLFYDEAPCFRSSPRYDTYRLLDQLAMDDVYGYHYVPDRPRGCRQAFYESRKRRWQYRYEPYKSLTSGSEQEDIKDHRQAYQVHKVQPTWTRPYREVAPPIHPKEIVPIRHDGVGASNLSSIPTSYFINHIDSNGGWISTDTPIDKPPPAQIPRAFEFKHSNFRTARSPTGKCIPAPSAENKEEAIAYTDQAFEVSNPPPFPNRPPSLTLRSSWGHQVCKGAVRVLLYPLRLAARVVLFPARTMFKMVRSDISRNF